MFATVKSWFGSLFGDSDDGHLLDRPKEDHQVKRQEAERKLDELKSRREELKEALEDKRSKYESAKEAGNEEQAQDFLRDAEEIKEELETVRGRIDETSKQRNLASNLANIKEIGESRGDDYWSQLREMEQSELVRLFQREEMKNEELHDVLGQTDTLSSNTLDSFSEGASQLHTGSELEEEWSDDTPETDEEVSEEPTAVGDIETESDTLSEDGDDETVEFS
ncbi:hypothetical protein IL252_14605 (plasmid) [Halomicrobium sp. IBSBa]|uniref:Uncharacterized protein n=1 Tax=Halomicrobium mukohataei TaxID=57705 RepID=A0A847UJ08_9EURY|nr:MULTISPECIES: hypothetical protein [Halomicrobium]MBO4249048.1 hypothetical protein [Halomicrobium sp. IBSBa]NLV11610.1 hypothetical protein [Halomicrobium mukohataei]